MRECVVSEGAGVVCGVCVSGVEVCNPDLHPNLVLLLSPQIFSSNRFSTARGRILWPYASGLIGEASSVPVRMCT